MSNSINSTTDGSAWDAWSPMEGTEGTKPPAGSLSKSTSPPAKVSEPGLGDQFNPFGLRGNGLRDYTQYFLQRFPNTVAGAETLLHERIAGKVCSHFPDAKVPGLNSGAEDIDIASDMKRFGDASQGWYERNVRIGNFEMKTDDINVQWQKAPDGSTYFSYDSKMYVQENTGDNRLKPLFNERTVRMAEWPLKGQSACAP